MNTVTLEADGRIVCEGKRVDSEPLVYLGYGVDLGQAYCLRSWFSMLERYDQLPRLNAFFPACIEQYRRCPPHGCDFSGFDHLAFSKTVEMIGFPGDPRLEIYNSLRGLRGEQSEDIRFIGLEGLLDIPLQLGGLKHVVFGDKVDVFEFETVFTFFEFIDGIIWELSFQYAPKECQLRR